MGYEELYRKSIEEPEAFWAEAARAIHWDKPWDKVLDDSQRAAVSLVFGRRAQHLLQRAGPARRAAAAATRRR
jgi:hypothetical protein